MRPSSSHGPVTATTAGRKIIPSPKRKPHWRTASAPFSTVPTPTMMSLRSIAMTASTLPPVARRNTPTPGYTCFVRTQGCNWSHLPHRYRRDIWLPHRPAAGGFLRARPLRPLRDPLEDIPHGRRFPFAAPRRGNASPVESGGDLTERLRPCSLSLTYRWHGAEIGNQEWPLACNSHPSPWVGSRLLQTATPVSGL